MRNVVCFFSSGAASFVAAKRMIESVNEDDAVFLVFADTLIEDEDNYRFLKESVVYLKTIKKSIEYIHLSTGETPWDVFVKKKYIGNSRIAPCSHELKQKQCRDWIKSQGFSPKNTTLVLGIDWQEIHRKEKITKNWAPFEVVYPLCEEPWLDRLDVFRIIKECGIEIPRLYKLGFSHANCGGFCVRAGKKQFSQLLEVFPEKYRFHENEEKRAQAIIGTEATILSEEVKSKTKSLSLTELRERLSQQLNLFEDWGGCGCFIDNE